jgi:putative multiple sugar transport system substrate-binding protein
VVALAAAGLTGCAVPQAPTVAVALPSDDGRWDDVAEVLRDRLAAAGYVVDLRVAGDDIPTQVRQLEQLLAASPAAVIVAPVDATSLTTVLDRAPAETEILALGTLVRDTGAVDRFVGFDPAIEGFLQATALLEGLGLVDATGVAVPDAPDGPFRIELFAGSVDDVRTEPSFAGAMSALQPYLDAGTLAVGSGESSLAEATTLRGNAATAGSRLTRLIRDGYEGSADTAWPDAVLAPSDAIARGVIEALIAAGAAPGETFPVVTGRGAELRAVAALLDGRQYSTQLEDPRLLAEEAAERMIAALGDGPPGVLDPTAAPPGVSVDNGARVLPATLLRPQTVRAGDIEEVLVGSGYWTSAQVAGAFADFGVEPLESPTPGPTDG